jgi:peptidoglycan-associated lipoprotein
MKKPVLFFILVLFGAVAAQAQPLNRSTPEANMKSAEEAEATYNYYEALDLYEKVYDETKDKAVQAKIAELNYKLRDYEDAERGFSRLVTRDRKGEYTELKYWYAMSLKANGKYPEAEEVFNQYIAEGQDAGLVEASKREVAGVQMARKLKERTDLTVANIGKKVNKPQTEASPIFSGSELYFVSMQVKDVINPEEQEGDEWYAKVYTASKAGAEYGDPTPLGTQINREGWHQGNVSISADGRTMYFTRVQLENNGLKESKIFYATKGSDGWGAANEVAGVNGDYLAKHPAEGELFGEKVLFFVANMPGGKGGFDLYYAPKKQDGVFGLPVNLGEVVNTVSEEASPFYRDGKLYFSTNGQPTIGGLDVFETQWNGSVWSAPKHMGLGINTSLDDQFYTQSADGYTGFLVSNRPGPNNLKSKTCCDDIYMWEVERVRVNLVAKVFRLRRTNEKENQPLTNSLVQIFDVTDKNPARVDEKTNPSGNDFSFTLQPDKSYLVIATREGYQPDSLTFNTVGVKKTQNIEKKLLLRLVKKEPQEVEVTINEPIRLNNIYYDFDDDKILPDAEDDLEQLADLLKEHPEIKKIELSSHTDARGKDDYNEALSQRRADSAKRWLLARGITADRIVAKGYGENQILNDCKNGVECDEEKHRFNRRTEFKITEGPQTITIKRIEKRDPADTQNKKPGGKN